MNFRQRDPSGSALGSVRSDVLSAFMSKVYGWMMLGILVTGIVSFQIGNTPDLVSQILSNQIFFWAVIIAQFGSVIFLMGIINRISATAAAITFLMYSVLTGITFSLIFIAYTQQSIANVFLTTAAAFGGLSMYGYVTKRDLGPIGSFCIMGLFGLIALMLLSFFIPGLNTNGMQIGFSVLGLVIFAGLTAYDTQRIKAMANTPNPLNQQAILGALILYLDFINLFINLLRLMGDRK